nr:signal peptidase I [Paenibacillus oenotherae]
MSDDSTPEMPATVTIKAGNIVINHDLDNMDRGNHEYEGSLVVHKSYCDSNEMKRGDVVYFRTPPFQHPNPNMTVPKKSISRVVALAGEKIEIKEGQIYIDGKQLDAFYGKAQSKGVDREQYKLLDAKLQNPELLQQFYHMNLPEVEIPADHVFVLGDTWWRSVDSQLFGPLPIEQIEGRVEGYPAKLSD